MIDDGRDIRVSFRILGLEFSPDEVSKILGIEPENSYKQGDLRFGNPRYKPYENHGWHIRSQVDRSEGLEAHIISLLDQVSTNPTYLKDISENNLVDFYCSVRNDNEEWIHLSSKTVERMSAIGASLSTTVNLDYELNSMKLKSTIQLPIRVLIVGVYGYDKNHYEDVFSDKNGFDLVEMISDTDPVTNDVVIEKIRDLNIDVTFVDESLGKSQSIELVCGINATLPDASIITLSQSNETMWMNRILDCGAKEILNTPIIIEHLYHAMNWILGKRKNDYKRIKQSNQLLS